MEMNLERVLCSKIFHNKSVSKKNMYECKPPITYTHLTSKILHKNTRTPCNPLHTNILNIIVSSKQQINLLKLKFKNQSINILNFAKRTISKV